MNDLILNIVAIGAGVAAGLGVSIILLRGKDFINLEKKEKSATERVQKSNEEASKIKTETREYVEKKKTRLAQEKAKREERITKLKSSLEQKEKIVKKREERNSQVLETIKSTKAETAERRDAIKKGDKETLDRLAQKSGTQTGQLKEEIITKYRAELESESGERLAKAEEGLKENANRIARKHIVNVLQRLCSPTSVETRAVNVKVPKDQIKGKVVGKNAQNIEELEKHLDVDIVFNDLPNTISLSAFNMVQRRIAQKTIEKLVKTRGGIDPGIVRKTIKAAEKETDEELYELGKKGLIKMGVKHDNKDFCRIVGRLKYRTSYGQNIMMHSMEVGWVATMLGSELGLDIGICKVGGFLHDLGKAIDQDPETTDTHDVLSKKIMEKYGFSKEEIHAAWTHHDAIPQETPEALIVKAADAVSAGRPGARQESFDKYIQRIKALEQTAEGLEGVKRAYAISAGREVRVMVDPETIDDQKLKGMAKDLAGTIEENITYPGKIKVNVIRRIKHTETAK